MRRRQHLGWTFRLGTRWARKARGGVLELTLGQQGPEPSRRQRRREEQSFFAWASARAAAGLSRQSSVRGARCRGKFQQNDDFMLRVSGVIVHERTKFDLASDSCSYKKSGASVLRIKTLRVVRDYDYSDYDI